MEAGVDRIVDILGSLPGAALTWLPLVFFGLIIYLLWRTLAFMPRVKPAEIDPDSKSSVDWDDIAGVDEAAAELQEVVDFLQHPRRFGRLGARVPKGILIYGPPGTGKTLLAKAVAHASGANFYSQSASAFVEMFAGLGAARIRKLFEKARKNEPAIVFIDELDAVGTRRTGLGLNREADQTLNQLLVELDGFRGPDRVVIIGASNRLEDLDPALLRPGRFDRQVVVGLPDIRGREQILKVHMRKVPISDDVDPSVIARGTPGFSGADLANLVNEAALFAARANKRTVTMEQFELAKDKIMMGAERKSMVMSEAEKRNTAYHEAGHAIVGRLVPEHDPVYKVSIIPRGRALGVTMFLPAEDRYSHSRRFIIGNICSLFGGRIAEEMILGADGVTTGASNDIKRATEMARSMVTKWGLSEKMGPLLYDESEEEVFLGRSAASASRTISNDTAMNIDQEVRRIIDECYGRAKQLLEENRDKLEIMSDALMQYETIDSAQIDDIMAGRKPRPPADWDSSNRPNSGGGEAPSEDRAGPIGGPAGEH
jgi:cell division protease FtsH